jgi:hypothetical protein
MMMNQGGPSPPVSRSSKRIRRTSIFTVFLPLCPQPFSVDGWRPWLLKVVARRY